MSRIQSMLAAGAVSLVLAAGSAHAATETFDLNQYSPSFDPTPGADVCCHDGFGYSRWN